MQKRRDKNARPSKKDDKGRSRGGGGGVEGVVVGVVDEVVEEAEDEAVVEGGRLALHTLPSFNDTAFCIARNRNRNRVHIHFRSHAQSGLSNNIVSLTFLFSVMSLEFRFFISRAILATQSSAKEVTEFPQIEKALPAPACPPPCAEASNPPCAIVGLLRLSGPNKMRICTGWLRCYLSSLYCPGRKVLRR